MKLHAGVDRFFFESLAGIYADTPAWETFVVKPNVLGGLTFAEASLKTVKGQASVRWETQDNGIMVWVKVPVGSVAKVHIPKLAKEKVTIKESGYIVWDQGVFKTGNPGVLAAKDTGDHIAFNVGSGTYVFKLTGQN